MLVFDVAQWGDLSRDLFSPFVAIYLSDYVNLHSVI